VVSKFADSYRILELYGGSGFLQYHLQQVEKE